RRGQFLHVALVAVHPGDWGLFGLRRDHIATPPANRRIWVVMNLAAGDVRSPLIQQCGELTDQPCLRLPAQSKKNEIVPREHCVDHLRYNRVVVAENPGKQRFPTLDLTDQIIAEFVLDSAGGEPLLREGAGAKRTKGTG